MLIIIAGDGKTGAYLAEILSGENQDIVLMGLNREHLAALDSEHNFMTVEGNPTYATDLGRCGIAEAGLFIAVTPDENMNIVGCEMARRLGAAHCAARIDSPELATDEAVDYLRSLGVDMVFLPEKTAAENVAQFVRHNWISEYMQLGSGRLLIVAVRMESVGRLCGKTLREASAQNPRTFHVSAIRRGEKIIIPNGDDVLEAGDMLYISTLSENLDRVRELCGKQSTDTHSVFIAGGGRITENLLGMLGGGLKVKVFEPDHERCRYLAARYPRTVFVSAPCDDVATLKEEGIEKCDMFLALTGNSESNMVACMVARSHGVAKTAARIEELQYIPEAESLRIDKIVNKKRINAGRVLDMLIDSGSGKGQCMSIDGAEIASLTVGGGSPVVSKPVSRLSLPRGLTLAAIMRGGEAALVDGDTVIEPGDVVVVLFLSGMMSKVRKLFK